MCNSDLRGGVADSVAGCMFVEQTDAQRTLVGHFAASQLLMDYLIVLDWATGQSRPKSYHAVFPMNLVVAKNRNLRARRAILFNARSERHLKI